METQKPQPYSVWQKRKKWTIIVLIGFILLACVASYLYNHTADHLDPKALQEQFTQLEQ